MKQLSITKIAISLLPMAMAASGLAQEISLDAFDRTVHAICEKTLAGVVRVKAFTEAVNPLDPEHRLVRIRAGSGFFIDPSGQIFTTASVVAGAHKIVVESQDRQYEARLIGLDKERSNLALLQVTGAAPDSKFHALAFSTDDWPRTGSMVVLLGFPGDMAAAPSVGFVGEIAMCRLTTPLITVTRLSLSPGESGAPFLDSHGRVLGVLFGSSGQAPSIAFALPAKAAQRVAADLRQFGEPHYGWLGLGVKQTDLIVASNSSTNVQSVIRITQVGVGSPADQAGVQPGDLLTAIGSKPIHGLPDIAEAMFYLRVGEQTQIQVVRSNQVSQFSMSVALRNPDSTATASKPESVPETTPISAPAVNQPVRAVPASVNR